MIYILREKVTDKQLEEMLEVYEDYIKLAVDIRAGIIAGGGEMHADCAKELVDAGSEQENIWGANWNPSQKQLDFGSLINIRPRQNNPSMDILDPPTKDAITEIVLKIFGEK
ncbi:DUF5674 family protein [candidate division KSB1 bacterium]